MVTHREKIQRPRRGLQQILPRFVAEPRGEHAPRLSTGPEGGNSPARANAKRSVAASSAAGGGSFSGVEHTRASTPCFRGMGLNATSFTHPKRLGVTVRFTLPPACLSPGVGKRSAKAQSATTTPRPFGRKLSKPNPPSLTAPNQSGHLQCKHLNSGDCEGKDPRGA